MIQFIKKVLCKIGLHDHTIQFFGENNSETYYCYRCKKWHGHDSESYTEKDAIEIAKEVRNF